MIGSLPKSLKIGEEEHRIRSDYRNVLQVFEAFSDPELTQEEKWIVAVYLLLEPFSCGDDVIESESEGFDVNEAAKQIIWFISAGQEYGDKSAAPSYDWAQDEQMIFSAVNKVAGKETRELPYLHWWTFLGYFNEIGEGSFSFVVGIRNKLNRGKKLEKHEKEFLSRNKGIVKLEKKKTKEEKEAEEYYKGVLDGLV